MYRVWLKRIESLLLLGSIATFLSGILLFVWPSTICGYLGIQIIGTLFVRFTALLIFLLGVTFAFAIINHEKNMAVFWLGGFEKVAASAIIAVYVIIDDISWIVLIIAALDMMLGALFFAYIKLYREDNWL